jgi:hypothetical protein
MITDLNAPNTSNIVKDKLVFDLSDGSATVGTDKDRYVYCPENYIITDLILACATAPTGANLIVDLNVNGTTILSTKISCDATERTSVTAATPHVLTTTSLTKGDILTADIDQIGSGGGSNVQLTLYVTKV